jgi:hypothetical protein
MVSSSSLPSAGTGAAAGFERRKMDVVTATCCCGMVSASSLRYMGSNASMAGPRAAGTLTSLAASGMPNPLTSGMGHPMGLCLKARPACVGPSVAQQHLHCGIAYQKGVAEALCRRAGITGTHALGQYASLTCAFVKQHFKEAVKTRCGGGHGPEGRL